MATFLLGFGFADPLLFALLPELHTFNHGVELGAVLEAGRLPIAQHDPHHLNDRLGQPVTRPLSGRRRLADIAVPIPQIVADQRRNPPLARDPLKRGAPGNVSTLGVVPDIVIGRGRVLEIAVDQRSDCAVIDGPVVDLSSLQPVQHFGPEAVATGKHRLHVTSEFRSP
jgi:hypothetical protein